MHGMAKLNDILCMQRKLCSVKCIVTKKKSVVCIYHTLQTGAES